MIVPIRALDGGEKDWTMIELQGEILHSQGLKEGFEFGKMRAQDTDGVKVELTIGYHQLIGKRVKLDKPFAVFKKVTVEDRVEYKVKGVIRYKYLFKQRPQAIISSPATGHGDA